MSDLSNHLMDTLPLPMQQYLNWVATQKHLSHATLVNYARDLQLLCELMHKQGVTEPTQLNMHHVRLMVQRLHGAGQQSKSIARYLSSWRSWCRWMVQAGNMTLNPVQGVRAPKGAKPLPKALGIDEAVFLSSHIPAAATTTSPLSTIQNDILQRDHAMIELLYSSGLRVSEIVGLDIAPPSDNDSTAGSGWVDAAGEAAHVRGKGNKERIVPVGAFALVAIDMWLQTRANWQGSEGIPALFIGKNGTRLTTRSVQLRLKQYAQRLGLSVHVHPHMLRHSFATHLLQSSGNLRAVQEMLGHANLSATQIYTALDFQHLAQIYDSAHPRAKNK